MKPEDIRKHRKFLEEYIEPDYGLLDKLRANRSLVEKEIEKIRQQMTSHQRNSKLIEYILRKKKCELLINALNGTQQTHIVNYIAGNGELKHEYHDDWPLLEKELSIIDNNYETLIDLLEAYELNSRLYSVGIINKRQRDFISSKATPFEKNEALLKILRRRSLRDYQRTIQCLRETKQGHIAKVLEEGGVIAKVHVTHPKPSAETDETEDEIIAKFKSIVDGKTPEQLGDMFPKVGESCLRIIEAKRCQSIMLYIYCKSIIELDVIIKMHISGKLKETVRRFFIRLLSSTQSPGMQDDLKGTVEIRFISQISNFTVSLSNDAFERRLTGPYKGEMAPTRTGKKPNTSSTQKKEQRCVGSESKINDLPPEVLDLILRKSYKRLMAKEIDSSLSNYIYKQIFTQLLLSSVQYSWFRRLIKRSFQKLFLRVALAFYTKYAKLANVVRNNRQFLETAIRTKNLVKQLEVGDCLTKVQANTLSRKKMSVGKLKDTQERNVTELLHFIRSLDETREAEFIRCLHLTSQKNMARVFDYGGAFMKAEMKLCDERSKRSSNKRVAERLNDLRSKDKPRLHEVDILITQLKQDGIEILDSFVDREAVAWIWCSTKKRPQNTPDAFHRWRVCEYDRQSFQNSIVFWFDETTWNY